MRRPLSSHHSRTLCMWQYHSRWNLVPVIWIQHLELTSISVTGKCNSQRLKNSYNFTNSKNFSYNIYNTDINTTISSRLQHVSYSNCNSTAVVWVQPLLYTCLYSTFSEPHGQEIQLRKLGKIFSFEQQTCILCKASTNCIQSSSRKETSVHKVYEVFVSQFK